MLEVASVPPSTRRKDVSAAGCDLSIVIPAYNEASRLPHSIRKIHEYLRAEGTRFEILVVDDGSTDGTRAIAQGQRERTPELRVLGYPGNRGKGFAVRTGMLQASGTAVLFSDADLSTPIEELPLLLRALEEGADVAIASRHLSRSRIEVRQPLGRRYLGRIFNLVISLLGVRGFADTQCGFKLFRAAEARRIFSRVKTDGFAFDVEALLHARRFGCRVEEVPVRWANSSASRVRPVRDSIAMLIEILKMRGIL